MGTKLQTVIFNPNLVTEKEISNYLLQHIHKMYEDTLREGNQDIPEKMPSPSGSYALEFTKPNHKYPMQMIFQRTLEDYARSIFSAEKLAETLSHLFPSVPFVKVGYHSVVDTGDAIVYIGGKEVEYRGGNEGDCNKRIGSIFEKHFSIPYRKNKAWNIIDAWFGNCYYHGQFDSSSISRLKYNIEKTEREGKEPDYFYAMEWNSIQLLIDNPSITEEEYKNLVKEKSISTCGYDMAKHIYSNYLDYVNQTYQSKVFLLTDGSLFSKKGLYLKEEAKEVQPSEWFELEDEARSDLEKRKDEKIGPRPKSYSLTKEELETLSYEEQKKKAFSLREIALKRGDNRGFTDWIYTQGIKVQSPIKEKDYIQIGEKIARVRFIRLVPDRENETFKEEASIAIKSDNGASIKFIFELSQFTPIPEENVPEEWKVSAS